MHFPKPWFRPGRNTWYVQVRGKQINLGSDEAEAFRQYHEMMARPKKAAPPPRSDSVAAICDRFLDWVQKNQAPDTYRWYKDRLQVLIRYLPQGLAVLDLKPLHIQEWIDGMTCKSGTKRNYVRSIKRAMLWAEEQGYVLRSPIAHLRKPRAGKRENIISPLEHALILQHTRDQNFRDLCTFCFETGARAMEALALESRHCELHNHRIVFPVNEEKMERAPRIIYLTEEAERIVARLCNAHRSGKTFRNTDGRPWEPDATNCRFRTIAKKIGRKVCLTDYRHSFCHRLLKHGVDALTVSVLMGHASPVLVATTYSHLSHATDYLSKIVRATPASVSM